MELVIRHTLVVLGFLLAVIIVMRLLREHRAPGNTVAWLLAIVLIPYIGVPLFLLLGNRRIGRVSKHREPQHLESCEPLKPTTFASEAEQVLYSTGIQHSKAYNEVFLITDSISAYQELVDLIENAKKSISIATFILGKDEIGKDIISRLTRRAKEGIEVRLLLDALGCFWTSRGFVAPLKKVGGKVGIFLPMLPYRRKWSAHLRNHRKIWIADERVAVVGGRNISSSYMGPHADEKHWADFGVRINGQSVSDLYEIFCSDWEFATREKIHSETDTVQSNTGAHPSIIDPHGELSNSKYTRLQVVASGPDTTSNSLYQGVLAAIVSAKQKIWIASPYFIPDEPLVRVLALAAQMGKDVRILVPRHSNHRIADFARGSYLRELNRHGVQCRAYEPGMMHTKLILIDQDTAILGSANMDLRSLYLNFEVGVFVYSQDTVKPMTIYFESLIRSSTALLALEPVRSDRTRLWFEDISRLFAPLL